MRLTIDTDAKTVTEQTPDGPREHPLDSPEAFRLISEQWLAVGWTQKYIYGFTWLGRPIIQLPEDMIRIQEVIYRVKPDVIVETGVAHGGSLIYYASLCKATDRGRVIGVDVEIRPHNRSAIEAHPLKSYITLIEGSSTDAATVAAVRDLIRPGERVLVLLDSCHTKAHVKAELEAYAPLVGPGSYIVATDGLCRRWPGDPARSRVGSGITRRRRPANSPLRIRNTGSKCQASCSTKGRLPSTSHIGPRPTCAASREIREHPLGKPDRSFHRPPALDRQVTRQVVDNEFSLLGRFLKGVIVCLQEAVLLLERANLLHNLHQPSARCTIANPSGPSGAVSSVTWRATAVASSGGVNPSGGQFRRYPHSRAAAATSVTPKVVASRWRLIPLNPSRSGRKYVTGEDGTYGDPASSASNHASNPASSTRERRTASSVAGQSASATRTQFRHARINLRRSSRTSRSGNKSRCADRSVSAV